MPKSCNSISKNLFLFLLLPFLFSCVVNPSSSKQKIYTGKFYVENAKVGSTFNTSIIKQGNGLIIQVSKPFFGNVLNLTIKSNGYIESTSSEDNAFINSSYTPKDYKKIYNWLNNCLDSTKLSNNETAIEPQEYLFIHSGSIRLVCSKGKDKISFDITDSKFKINGHVLT